MKTYDEMKENVFRRIEDIEAEKKRKRKIYTRTAAAVAPLCAAGAAVFTLWGGGAFGKGTDSEGVKSFNAIAGVESFGSSYAASFSETSTVVDTKVAVSRTDIPENTTTEKAEATSVHEVQPDTEEQSAEEEKTTAESTTAPRATTAERNTVAPELSNNNAVYAPANLGDFLAWVNINGESYVQVPEYNGNADIFAIGSYVGAAGDFDSYYTEGLGEDSDLYTVAGHDDLLIMEYRAPASGRLILQKKNSTSTAPQSAPPANLWCIFVSSISYNGTDYRDSTVNISSFTQDRYIGKVSDFAGSYGDTGNYRINPGDSVYTVKETPDLLLVVKADSSSIYGSVIPMCSSSFSGDSYGFGSLVPNLTIPDGAVIN